MSNLVISASFRKRIQSIYPPRNRRSILHALHPRYYTMPATNEDSSCLFCKILNGSIPCHKVYETEHSFAFLDIMPTSEGHTQVIPKYHAETIANLPDEYLADIGPVVKKVALATGAEAYNIVQVGFSPRCRPLEIT
ncbi:hypothetical protein E1B28_008343 [Marasmius oreades]|uniref:HIT domain-containing protein n=1 Tax=Marasmius oreades TaxID=181124 RepID=A0A9P7UU71_9AGAR|nr:uncharacterized protein E1B28_008343 [Marasmius oreades]KAG7091954.1 hypothetical protein E1B28_008343 [Marasmius oreades]